MRRPVVVKGLAHPSASAALWLPPTPPSRRPPSPAGRPAPFAQSACGCVYVAKRRRWRGHSGLLQQQLEASSWSHQCIGVREFGGGWRKGRGTLQAEAREECGPADWRATSAIIVRRGEASRGTYRPSTRSMGRWREMNPGKKNRLRRVEAGPGLAVRGAEKSPDLASPIALQQGRIRDGIHSARGTRFSSRLSRVATSDWGAGLDQVWDACRSRRQRRRRSATGQVLCSRSRPIDKDRASCRRRSLLMSAVCLSPSPDVDWAPRSRAGSLGFSNAAGANVE